jgi:hypothetical protein
MGTARDGDMRFQHRDHQKDILGTFGNNGFNGYNWKHHVRDTWKYIGGTTWGGHKTWVSVPSGTGTTLVEVT